MKDSATQRWLSKWGYKEASAGLHRRGDQLAAQHAYRNEISELLDPSGPIQATAVFDVDGVPAICFLEDDGSLGGNEKAINQIREKIWNQNLISVVLLLQKERAVAMPVGKKDLASETVSWSKASDSGPHSFAESRSGDLFRRCPEWFAPEARVDQVLLRNLSVLVDQLVEFGLQKADAQYLMAQVLFIAYLEQRDIVGNDYRAEYDVEPFNRLVNNADCSGIVKLLDRLKASFNGDFLEPENKGLELWKTLPDEAFELLSRFLRHDDLTSGQTAFWPYDFRFIPVELISGIYESFLSEQKRNAGAYYTPRNLANLAVNQAFLGSPNILEERIFDGACGSGILLTTAYRRMLSFAEARNDRKLDFAERCKLLLDTIFGADINEMACRVTAFSLYLSILEGLQPADISKLQHDEQVKLPPLSKTNIVGGKKNGDFFSESNFFINQNLQRFTILLSNPPWVEPGRNDQLSSDVYARSIGINIPRRQTAGAFMMRAGEYLGRNGRFCLILPISMVAAPTSAQFMEIWLQHYKLERLINFGDIRKLLFPTAKQPCAIASGCKRTSLEAPSDIPGDEAFEYWTPKADISFAFGRLTLQSADRHWLPTRITAKHLETLTTLYWGTRQDIALIAQLRLKGDLDKVLKQDGWTIRKGFHRHDSSVRHPASSKPLRNMPYLSASDLHSDSPILHENLLKQFPPEIATVAKLPKDLLELFTGPKIIFKDGLNKDRRVVSAYSNQAFSFNNSIGVIAAPEHQAPLLLFIAAYLHSSLAQFVLMLTAYQINFERERVTVADIRGLPFIAPDRHSNQERAEAIIEEVAQLTRQQKNVQQDLLHPPFDMEKIDELIFEYFELNPLQQDRVRELIEEVAPHLQPGSVENLETPLQRRPDQERTNAYANALRKELLAWSQRRRGHGDLTINITINSASHSGALGIVRITPGPREADVDLTVNDAAVDTLLSTMSQSRLLPLENMHGIDFLADGMIWVDDDVYLVKPMVSRFWLQSQASRDAESIARSVIERATQGG